MVDGQRNPGTDTSRCRCGRDDRHHGARDRPPRGPDAHCGNWSSRLRAPDVLVGGATKTVVDRFALVAGPHSQVHGQPIAAQTDAVAGYVKALSSVVVLDPSSRQPSIRFLHGTMGASSGHCPFGDPPRAPQFFSPPALPATQHLRHAEYGDRGVPQDWSAAEARGYARKRRTQRNGCATSAGD